MHPAVRVSNATVWPDNHHYKDGVATDSREFLVVKLWSGNVIDLYVGFHRAPQKASSGLP